MQLKAVIVWIAITATTTASAPPGRQGPPELNTVLNNLTVAIVGLLSSLATVALTIGGVMYLMAGGDPEQVRKAKTALKNAAIGYGIAILAPALLLVLKKIVGQS
jgi:hypothetical protein